MLKRNFLEPSIPQPKSSKFPSNQNESTQTNQNLIDPETDQKHAKPNPKFTQQLRDPTPQKAINTFLNFLAGRPLSEYLREFPLQRRRRRRWGSCGVITVHFSRGESNDRGFTKSYEIDSTTSWRNRAESQLKSRRKNPWKYLRFSDSTPFDFSPLSWFSEKMKDKIGISNEKKIPPENPNTLLCLVFSFNNMLFFSTYFIGGDLVTRGWNHQLNTLFSLVNSKTCPLCYVIGQSKMGGSFK